MQTQDPMSTPNAEQLEQLAREILERHKCDCEVCAHTAALCPASSSSIILECAEKTALLTAHAKELAELREKYNNLKWHANAICALTNKGDHDITKSVAETIDDLRAQLADARARNESLCQEVVDAEDESDTLKQQLTDSQSMVEHLRLELEAHRNGTVAKDAEDMAADNARLSAELAASQKRVRELEADKARLDWLEHQTVNVRIPLVHGSRDLFWAAPEDCDGDETPSEIRSAIDSHMKRKRHPGQAAHQSPKQEGM